MRGSTRKVALVAAALIALLAGAGVLLRERLFGPRLAPLVTASGRALSPLCAAAAKAACSTRLRCGEMERAQLEACLDDTGAECERSVGWRLRAGVVAADAEAQAECLEGLGDSGCNALQALLGDDEPQLFELTTQCELGELLRPRAGLGAPCAESSDCTAGFCPGLAPACHRCSAFAEVGQPCSPGAQECDPARARCTAGVDGVQRCLALSADGAPCLRAGECAARACRGAEGARTCSAAAEGAPCAGAGDCATGQFCRQDAGRAACAPRARTGEPCGDDPLSCAEPEASCVAGKCRVRPFLLGVDEVCRDFTDCKEGLYCSGARGGALAGRCVRQAAAGSACAPLDFGACGAAATCLDGKCHRLRAAGEKCRAPYQCKAFLSCVPASAAGGLAGGGICAPDPHRGEPCDAASDRCVDSHCDAGSGRCVALAPGGAPCDVSGQCESHWCVGRPGGGGTCYAPCPG